MTLDGTYTATVDRIVEGQAVLLVEADGQTVAERYLPEPELPDDAGEGAVLELTLERGELVDLAYRPEETTERRERMREKFDRLSRRLGEEDEAGEGEGTEDDP